MLYLPAFGFGFVWDDHRLIERNAMLRSVGALLLQLRSDFWLVSGVNASGFWRPLVSLSYALDGALGGWQPWLYHVMNAVGHAVASGLVAVLVAGTGAGFAAALLAGLWFAAMPAHVESVAWIAGRTDVYCAVGFLLALVLDRRARAQGRRWPGLLPLVAAGVALASKEAALPLVLVVAVAEWVERRAPWRSRLRWLAPYAALTALYLVLHVLAVQAPERSAALDSVTRERGRWAAWTLFPGYLAFLWPGFPHSSGLTVRLPARAWAPEVIGGAVTLALYGVALGLALQRRARSAVPLALFGATALPPILAMAIQGTLLHAERFVYLPSAGAAWALGLALAWAHRRPATRAASVALASVLVIASGWTLHRILPHWKSDATLFESMTRIHPRNAMAHIQWARVLIEQGREEEARAELTFAEALDPHRAELHSARARLHHRLGEWSATLEAARRAQAIDPGVLEPHVLHAGALLRLGRPGEAHATIDSLRRAWPDDPAIEALWGECLLTERRPAEALPFLERAARALESDAELAFALGMARASLGHFADARDAFARAVALDPTLYDGWLRLAQAAHLAGDAVVRERALAAAASLPESRDGRAEALRASIAR